MISERVVVSRGMKIGDVDPRGDERFVHIVSDKARAVGRAALEAALSIGRERGLFEVRGTGGMHARTARRRDARRGLS